MNEMEAKEVIIGQGWTPRILPRRHGIKYLYAAKRENKKVHWCYIGPLSRLGEMTQEKIVEKINRKQAELA